ncbi:MAG TPA: transglycosylase SLT domain-containing protein [Candidatus Eisenbacteria bacterium]|nr:transglycosylase SLT domain-containing protein [Candidatus Eisenbacteria bacterium]
MLRRRALGDAKWFVSVASMLAFVGSTSGSARSEAPRFPVLPGLERSVEFWKQIFTRFSTGEVVFHDPQDPLRIYGVIAVPEGEQARAVIEAERVRIMDEHELGEEEGRVRAQRGVRERFLAGLKVSGRYLAQMQKIFREEGVPVELTYLPMVESSFNVHARSSAGAVGMWQFMPETGKRFLRVTDAIDERKDPFASTRAAARLLKENYRILGDWPLAITAYNHGAEGIARGVAVVGSRNLVDLIRQYQSPSFGFASKNFYAEFLAVLEIMEDREQHFPRVRLERPLALKEIEIEKPLAVQPLLRPLGITREQFFEWNPAVNSSVAVLPAGYRVRLPSAAAGRFPGVKRRVEAAAAAVKRVEYHRVSRGDTLLKIAGRYRVSVQALRQANGLSGHSIIIGQQLKIPRA